jgi:glycosyltransferase involved in cell wall biosynthesis
VAAQQPRAYTAVIACRDDDANLGHSIGTVLNQTLAPSELIVVLNPGSGSDSQAAGVARSFGGAVRILEASLNGLIAGLNAGIESANTKFIAFLDSDDLWEPQKQERQVQQLMTDPTLDA